jgi:hypothetical protein
MTIRRALFRAPTIEMTEDLETVNGNARTMSRDIDALRQRYLEHRQALERLAANAPTETLAQRYRQVIAEIDAAVQKLADLERGIDPAAAAPAATSDNEFPGRRTAPGLKSLRSDPQTAPLPPVESTGPRTILILVIGVVVLAVLGYFIWRFATRDEATGPATTTAVSDTLPPVSTQPAKPILTVDPQTQDYGIVSRGSRATRQFELLNNTDQPMTIRAQRSGCRCLWFEYSDTIPPQGSTTMTVTVDGAKAPSGPLHETVEVASRADPKITTTFEVVADIQ